MTIAQSGPFALLNDAGKTLPTAIQQESLTVRPEKTTESKLANENPEGYYSDVNQNDSVATTYKSGIVVK